MAFPTKPDCPTSKVTGKFVAVDINWEECGNVADPSLLEFKSLGGMQSKGVDRAQNTEDVTDDKTVGDYAEMIGTTKNFTFSGNGIMDHTDSNKSNLASLDWMYSQEGPTYLHVRITEPHITTYAYVLVSNFSKEWPATAPITFELEMVATASQYGVKTVETVPFVAPAGVTMTPPTATIAAGATQQLTSIVTPSGAPQRMVYVSSKPNFATVSQSGLVTGVATGVAVIIGMVSGRPDLTATSTVTVTS